MDKKRKHDRKEGKTYSEMSIVIQDGFMSHQIIPKLVDFSSSGAQFIADRNENIKVGLTALIHTFAGTPPEKHVIEAKIVWVSDEAGKVLFGCQFLEPLTEAFQLS